MTSLAPYKPTRANPWDRAHAAHLLRRSGFSPSESEILQALEQGPAQTVRSMLEPGGDSPSHDELDQLGRALAVRDNIESLRGWWLLRMCRTTRPLAARMSVFWHNHFATSNAKVRSAALMLQQLRTLERDGLGRFEDLLLAVARDPAMIIWLDAELNVKGRPNENFAREVLELFSLGVGNYSEHDIREAARAFTGWQQRAGRFRVNSLAHDDGTKKVFGQTGRFDGADVIRLAVERPACGRFLAGKLLREFLCPEPPLELVDALAAALRENHFDIANTLGVLLASEAMFDARYARARIKSPVELVVGMVRSLELHVPASALASASSQMGQRLFEPPSVKGWNGHREWLNSATMLVRLNTATQAVSAEFFEPRTLIERYELNDAGRCIEFAQNLTIDGRVPDALRRPLRTLSGSPAEVLREALRLLLTSPEYQMA